MKTHFKHFVNRLRASVLLCGLLATGARAAEPVEWTARPGDGPKAFARHHGSTLEFRCTFTGFGGAFAPDADLRLWYQTNGMGQAWWSVPASRSNDVLSASWPPTADPGADRISFFFGAPSNAYASAVLRMQSSPGSTPNILQPPVLRLDFDGLDVLNAPYYTQAETDARIVELSPAAQPPGNYLAVSNAAMHAVTFDEYGEVTVDRLLVHDLAVNGSPGWPTYRILFGPNELDGTYLYWDANSGRFASWRTSYGGDYLATALDVANSAVAATNYTNASISPTNPAFAAAVRNVPITGADSSDLAEIAEYGSYGTVGAAILALIAGLAALKRGKLDKSAVIDPSLATIADLGQAADALAVQGLVANINDSIDEATHYAVHIIEAGNDGYQLEDIVDNIIQVGGPEFDGAISLLMPPAVEGRIRDFLVEVDNNGSIAAEIEIPEWGETVAIGWAADDDVEEMLTVEQGTKARFYFSERGVPFVAGMDPQSGEPIELPLIMMRRLDVVSEQI